MAKDNSDDKLTFFDFWKDNGEIELVIDQLERLYNTVGELANKIKADGGTLQQFLNGLTKGSKEYKVVLAALQSVAEQMIGTTQKLAEVESREYELLQKARVEVEKKTRDKKLEAQIVNEVSGSYARGMLELKKLLIEYKELGSTGGKTLDDIKKRSQLLSQITAKSFELTNFDKQLKLALNGYSRLTDEQKKVYEATEREVVANDLATKSMKERIKAQEQLRDLQENGKQTMQDMIAKDALELAQEKMRLETRELELKNEGFARELSSTEQIKQRLAIKNQLIEAEAKLKALQTDEAAKLAEYRAKAETRQRDLDAEAKIIEAESQEGKLLAEKEARLKRINQENQLNAQLATSIKDSQEYNVVMLQKLIGEYKQIASGNTEDLDAKLAQIQALQQVVSEGEAWLNLTKQLGAVTGELNNLTNEEYVAKMRVAEQLSLQLEYKRKLIDAEEQLKALNTQEAVDLAELNAQVATKRALNNIQAQINQAQSQEGKLLAEKEARLKAINNQNEVNAQLVNAVKGSYAYNHVLLQKLIDDYRQIASGSKEDLKNTLDEISALQKLVKESELWLKATKEQAAAVSMVEAYTDGEYTALLKSKAELELEVKYQQQLIDSEAKLNAMRKAAATNPNTGKSQLEEIRYNELLAKSYKEIEDAKARTEVSGTDTYKQSVLERKNAIDAEKRSRLEAIAAMTQEQKEQLSLLDNTRNLSEQDQKLIGTYAQLDARYKLLLMDIEALDSASPNFEGDLEKLIKQANALADKLEKVDKAAGRTSNRMSSRQREWDGLTNSVYQLTRELPNLAVRADTFFLAISNNIPIFIDELKRAKNEVGSLAGAWAKAGKAFLKSFPLAVLLLILSRWSDMVKIFDNMFGTLADGTRKVNSFYRAMEQKVSTATSSIVKQVYNVRMLSKEWAKLDSVADRGQFLAKYRKEIDQTGLAINDVNDAEKAFGQYTDIIVEAYISRMKAAAAAAVAEDDYKEAVEKAFEAEKKATKIFGKPVTELDMRKMFAERFGLTDEKQIRSGIFKLKKEDVERIVKEAIIRAGAIPTTDSEGNIKAKQIMTSTNPNGRTTTSYVDAAIPKMVANLMGSYNKAKSGETIRINKELAEWLGVAANTEKTTYGVRNALQAMADAMAKGDQAAGKSAEYMEQYADSIEETGIKLQDLEKKINDFDLKALKALNDSMLDLMTNPAYESGGVEVSQPKFEVVKDEQGNDKVVESSETKRVLSSFDKQRLTDSQKVQEQIKEWRNIIEELNKLWAVAAEDDRKRIDAIIANYKQAIVNETNSLNNRTTQTVREENAAMARLYADNLNMRLEAIKDGNDKEMALRLDAVKDIDAKELNQRLSDVMYESSVELELRKKAIRANMNAELAENLTLEPKLRKSVAAIREKYRLEEERAVREHLIKINGWRKQQIEIEVEAIPTLDIDYYSKQLELARIELENELLENAELIENGMITIEAITAKHNKKIKKLWNDHRKAVISSQKSMWDVVEELAQTDSYDELTAKLAKYDLELEQTLIDQKDLIDKDLPTRINEAKNKIDELTTAYSELDDKQSDEAKLIQAQISGLNGEIMQWHLLTKYIQDYIDALTKANEKRKAKTIAELTISKFQKTQEIEEVTFSGQYQVGEQQSELFALKQEREFLQLRLQNAAALDLSKEEIELINAQLKETVRQEQKLQGWQGTVSRVADHGLAGLIQLPSVDAEGNKNWGGMKDLSTDQYDALSMAIDSVTSSLNECYQAWIDVAQAAYDAAQAQVDSARTAYEAELEARANGYANDVEGAKRELALEKSKAKQKEQILKQAQKAQERINTLQQISSLITGSAQILETFGAYPAVAAVMLALMWGTFAAAKIQANQVANQSSTYGGGGFELAVGGSHASGKDIKTGIKTRKGSQMVIEGGEGVGVFSKKAVSKYGDALPEMVDSINDGSLKFTELNDYGDINPLRSMLPDTGNDVQQQTKYVKSIIAMQPINKPTDLSTIEGIASMILERITGQPVVLSDGSILERKGNKTTITRRS